MFFTIRGKTLTFYLRLVLPALAIIFIVTTLLLRIASNTPYPASAAGPVVFHGTVSPLVAQNHLIGPADPNQRISLTIGLRPRNAEGLTRYAQDISNPKSVNFHRYLTSANVADVFGPTPAAHVAVLKFLQEYGLTITQTYKHRLLISFSGTISQIEQAFHVTINNYSALDGHIFYANTNDPTLPASIVGVVQSISGLNNATLLHHSTLSIHNITMPKSLPHTLKCPGPGSGIPGTSNSYLIPNQIATAYNLTGLYNAGYKGEGQTMALFELGTFQMNDLNSYISCFGNNHAAIQTVVTGQGKVPTDSGVLEVELDAELALSAAPQLGLLRIYEAANDIADYNAEWARIIQDAPPVVSTSWGDCEPAIGLQEAQQENIFFTVAAAQGQSIFSASGDGGSIGCYLDNPPSPYQLWGDPDDPASQPFVTGVGGTTLFYTGHYNSEATWNDTATPGGGASGGGKSSFWVIPSWQNAPSIVYAPGDGYPCKSPPNGLCREVPDVSLSADPNNGYIIYCSSVAAHCAGSGNWYTVGGTSAAAPMWAAMMVLTNEMSLKMGGFNLGFINPLLYQISNNASSYSSSFHDVYIGHNDVAGMSAHEYDAGPNYDMATGLGSYNAFALATNLVSLAQSTNGTRTSPANTTWYFAEGIVGGGFQEFLTMQNPSPVQAASINVTYLFQSRSAITIAHTVPASSRFTVYVNQDLGIPPTATQQPISAIVQVTNGPGIVVERPMYFKFKGIQSGTDVIGATSPGTSYYFPEADTRQSGSTYYTYITMLNPSSTLTANATVTFYNGSCGLSSQPVCATQTIVVPPLHRGTIIPPWYQQMSFQVTSDNPIVVERPMYFRDTIPTAGGLTTGASSEIGAKAPGNDWLFAEGYTGGNFQEYLILANFGMSATSATITLEYSNGNTQAVQVQVSALGRTIFDVNQANANPSGTCIPTPCATTTTVSAEITSAGPIVADRLMYFHYGSARFSGGTDIVGERGPSSHTVYAFAEGYTANTFQEFLTLQNPTSADEPVAITLFADTYVMQQQITVKAHSRMTFGVNSFIIPIAQAYNNMGASSYAVSITVQALGTNAKIVAERPMYFDFYGDPGGTDVLGYTGG